MGVDTRPLNPKSIALMDRRTALAYRICWPMAV